MDIPPTPGAEVRQWALSSPFDRAARTQSSTTVGFIYFHALTHVHLQ
jgi:hypothetical protein